jgi:hypothetical protein
MPCGENGSTSCIHPGPKQPVLASSPPRIMLLPSGAIVSCITVIEVNDGPPLTSGPPWSILCQSHYRAIQAAAQFSSTRYRSSRSGVVGGLVGTVAQESRWRGTKGFREQQTLSSCVLHSGAASAFLRCWRPGPRLTDIPHARLQSWADFQRPSRTDYDCSAAAGQHG